MVYGIGDLNPNEVVDKVAAVGMNDERILVEFQNNGSFELDARSNHGYLHLLINAKLAGLDVCVRYWPEVSQYGGRGSITRGSIVSLLIG